MIHVKQQRESNTVVLECRGAFDTRAVEEMISVALQQPPSCTLVIDLARATTIYDSALGLLDDSLSRLGHTIRGVLGRHARPGHRFLEESDSDGVHAHTD